MKSLFHLNVSKIIFAATTLSSPPETTEANSSEGVSVTSSNVSDQQPKLIDGAETEPVASTSQKSAKKQYETPSQDRTKKEIQQLESRFVSLNSLKDSGFNTPANKSELEDSKIKLKLSK